MVLSQPLLRCRWAEGSALMQAYHDAEWGVPIKDSRMLWEMLMLEGFQAGLSWSVVLNKREAFRHAFAHFKPETVARFNAHDVERLLGNAGIIRSRAKIEATIKGAQIYCEMQSEGQLFSDFCWEFTGHKTLMGDGVDMPTQTALSQAIANGLKKRGFKFVGPTIVYAWMQAVGMVNDHESHCFRRQAL